MFILSLFRFLGVFSIIISDYYFIFGFMNGLVICLYKYCILIMWIWNDESRKNFINDLKKIFWIFFEFFDDMEDMYFVWECLFKLLIDFYFFIKRKRF